MSIFNQNPSKRIKIRRDIIRDRVHPKDLRQLNIQYACEQCSFFDFDGQSCTMGFVAKLHLEGEQKKLYERTGRMAICRFMEID
ncbi:MAG: hypothetical protein KDD59_00815 [Bdellovibrionales bacterium]|nr:hypothetical protein [Bdellovibrionales bacterium]